MPAADRPHAPDPRADGRRRLPLLGDRKYGRERINRTYGETGQMLYSYKLTFTLPTDAGILEYLRGRTFQVPQVAFAEKYFPGFTLPDVETAPKTET